MIEQQLILGNKYEFPTTYTTTPMLEIADENTVFPHSGYIIDSSLSITHVGLKVPDGQKKEIAMIKGWRVIGQSDYNDLPLEEGMIIYICKEDYDKSHVELESPFVPVALLDTYQSVWENQITVEEGISSTPSTINGQQGYEMRLTFNPPLERRLDKVTGLYLANNKTIGPNPLYGTYSLTSGLQTYRATGDYGWSIGQDTLAQSPYSFTQGELTAAYGRGAHAEGLSSIAAGNYSHAEGESCLSLGKCSHAGGRETQALGECSLAYGLHTIAQGKGSIALGNGTIVKNECAVAVGQYNTGECKDAYFEIGIGEKDNRKTGFYMDKTGMAYLPHARVEDIEAQDSKVIVTKEYALAKLQEEADIQNLKIELTEQQINTRIEPIEQTITTRLIDSSDYVVERGRKTADLTYNNNPTSQGDADAYNTTQTVIVYYEKWASGRSVCRFDSNKLIFKNMARGNGGGHYVSCKIILPLSNDNTPIFQHWRWPALVTAPDWRFSNCIDNSSNLDYLHIVLWENNIFGEGDTSFYSINWSGGKWIDVETSFFVEVHGFWKSFDDYDKPLSELEGG